MPLTKEQFQKARDSGFSFEQIVGFEQKRTANPQQTIRSPWLAGLRSVAEAIPGTTFATEYYRQGGPFNKQALQRASEAVDPILQARTQGLPAKIGEAVGAVGPFLGLSSPFMAGAKMLPRFIPPIAKSALGLGSYEAARQGIGGGDPLQGFGQGALAGALFHGGGRIGATLAPKNMLAQRIGSAAGMGTIGAATAPEGDRFVSGAMGLGLGALSPSRPFGKTKLQYTGEAINEYRTILRPTQGEIKNLEVRQGKNINDYYRLAAEEQLPLKQSADKKLDTTSAREKLEPKQAAVHEKLNEQLKANPAKQFDLVELARKAKIELRKTIENDTDYKAAARDVNRYVSDAIQARGRYVSGEQLNNFKKGMWSVSYDLLKPNTQSTARKLGFIAKEQIQDAYPSSSIKQLNELSGKYSTLTTLLQNAHGRVVAGGRLSRHMAELTGAIAGSKIPVIGSLAGRYVGGKTSDFLYAPERAARLASRKAQKGGIVGESFRQTLGQAYGNDPMRTIPARGGIQLPYSGPQKALPYLGPAPYKPMGYPGNVPPQRPMVTPYTQGGPAIQAGRPEMGYAEGKEWYRNYQNQQLGEALKKQILAQVRGETLEFSKRMRNKSGQVFIGGEGEFPTYAGEKEITTKVLSKLVGRSQVSKEFIMNLTNQPELKQAERDLIRQSLEEYGRNVPVKEFADKVKTQLLPLKMNDVVPQWEGVTLKDEIRGSIQHYAEHHYASPIQTSAGQQHYGSLKLPSQAENKYFAHARIEDLPGFKMPKKGLTTKIDYERGTTRRIIELQSDLFQKGNLESETMKGKEVYKSLPINESKEFQTLSAMRFDDRTPQQSIRLEQLGDKAWLSYDTKKQPEINKLRPYENTWHERIIREEIKQAAKDGKTKLQFPTGETAMKIEGLGDANSRWFIFRPRSEGGGMDLKPDMLKVGLEINNEGQFATRGGNNDWIITDVLGDGKFKAMPKGAYENQLHSLMDTKPYLTKVEALKQMERSSSIEAFDISGKVDTNNPIYRFYEKEVARYLKRVAPDTKLITDKQGVTWYELNVPKEAKSRPIEAFGMLGPTAATGIGLAVALKASSARAEGERRKNLNRR